MSEYQFYDFRAVDCPLTSSQRTELGKISTRAHISSTRFTNFYTFGDFKGNPVALVERYFDAFLYLANWGTRELMFRVPLGRAPSVRVLRSYLSTRVQAAAWFRVVALTSSLDFAPIGKGKTGTATEKENWLRLSRFDPTC